MSTFEHKNSLRTVEAQIVQKLKNNEARPKFTGFNKKKRVLLLGLDFTSDTRTSASGSRSYANENEPWNKHKRIGADTNFPLKALMTKK